MKGDLTPIEARFKEILFLGVEELQATQGALYLLDQEKFKLITQYGFKRPIRAEVDMTDELVRHFKFQRSPVLVNAPGEDPRFAARLAAEESIRMLVVPVHSHGRLTGFVDLRDKAGKRPFTESDVNRALRLVDRLLDLYTEWDLFEHASLSSPELSRVEKEGDEALEKLVTSANEAIERGALRGEVDPIGFADPHITAANGILAAVVALPGALIASFLTGKKQLIASRSTLSDDALLDFERRCQNWLRQHNEMITLGQPVLTYPFGASAPIASGRVASMITAPVKSNVADKAFLTIAFETTPSPDVLRLAESFLRQMGELLSLASSWQQLHSMRKAIAENLLQPPSQHFQSLAAHSYRVAGLAEQLGSAVGLTSGELENLKLSALVHDVGMRFLNYQRLYRKVEVSQEELSLMRAHNAVGAVVIAQSPLGKQIARDVYHHHDRPDHGPGQDIPIGSRVIHICEAFDAMTAPDSYKAPVAIPAALDVIAAEAGKQFDAQLANKFIALMR